MLKNIPKSDIVTRPFRVYKEWTLSHSDITPLIGENIEGTLFDADTDRKTAGQYRRIVYRSIKSQFYNNADTGSVFFDVGLRENYASQNERNLLPPLNLVDNLNRQLLDDDGVDLYVDAPYNTIAVFPIPQRYYGEGVKIGSVILRDTLKNKTYTDDGYSNLRDSNNEIRGNVFYDRGLIVMHQINEATREFEEFTLNFNSTITIYENEIFLSVNESEFNVSQNPTAYDTSTGRIKLDNIQSQIDSTKFGGFGDYEYSSSVDPNGSYLAPYITTIGLYDDVGNMVAAAKLPKPIKSLSDYPVNFIVRFDT